MGALYPSQDWADALASLINASKAVEEHGKTWGVGFKGDFLFEIQPGAGLERTTYFYLNFQSGKAVDSRIAENRPEVAPGYIVTGPYANWKPVVKGEKDFIESVIKGQLKLEGDMGKVMRNAKFVRAVANALSKVDAEYLGE
jgi:putative sterol carrier protein